MMKEPLSSDHQKHKLEATLTKKVKEYLEVQPDVLFYKASDRYNKGVSDVIVCVKGQFVALELKAENNQPSPHQLLFLNKLNKAGGLGGVCYTLGEVKDLVDRARRRASNV